MKGRIFDIKRFAVHDGDGIRTTVFFKGCPLSCLWCHNPEGIEFCSEIQYVENKCLNCGKCVEMCENAAHKMLEGVHRFDRSLCVRCGKCTEACMGEAMEYCGKEMSVDEVLEILLEDMEFYIQSGGGVTLSGGECLCQADFCAELLKKLKKHGINCNVDTSGCVERTAIERVAPYTDVFLYDIKHMDAEMHRKYTGTENSRVIENLKYLDSLGKQIEIRIPVIPGVNDDEGNINKTGELLSKIKNIKRVKILPYNNLAGSKYESIGRANTMPKVNPPTKDCLEKIKKILESYHLSVCI